MSKWTEFRDEAERIIAYGARLFFPILATVAPALGLPVWVGALAGSIVPQVMGLVQANMPATGAGPMRKQKVLNILNGFTAVLEKELTGGAKVNLDALMPTISKLIDQTITAANELAPKVIADDVPSDPTSPLKTL
jgi:hypothetical protein